MLFDLHPKESPEELFGRDTEIKEIIKLVKNGSWISILGPRMIGKSSLLKACRKPLENEGYKTIYVNLWGIKSLNGFLNVLVEALNNSRSLFSMIKDLLRSINGISLTSSGFSVSFSKRPTTTLFSIFSIFGRINEHIVIELDELEELSSVSHQLLKLFANIFNTYENITFIFSGSMFGLMRVLLEPSSASPLYGRSPAKIFLKPFSKEVSIEFLKRGFMEHNVNVMESNILEAVDELDGIVGWLTLYGNNIAVKSLNHEEALKSVFVEGSKIVLDELEHFLKNRDKKQYMVALSVMASKASWSEIKHALETKIGIINDATLKNIIDALLSAMIIKKENKKYSVVDPVLRRILVEQF
ncbi:MAG: AAA family ATPase [Thermoprotei archaeon]